MLLSSNIEPGEPGAVRVCQRHGGTVSCDHEGALRSIRHRVGTGDDAEALVRDPGRPARSHLLRKRLSGFLRKVGEHRRVKDDHVFGVPLFWFRGEPFWGHDRMALLEERLAEAGLAR